MEPLPARPGSRKNLISTPKFYLFDTGVARTLRRTSIGGLRGAEAGHLFETFIANKLFAYLSCNNRREPVHFYRTKAGSEIDFVLNHGAVLIECKLSADIRSAGLRALNQFLTESPKSKAIVVSMEPRSRVVEAEGRRIEIHPWREFCQRLWAGKIW